MARIFLYIVAGLVVLAVVVVLLLGAFKDDLSYWAMTPGDPFEAAQAPPAPDYADAASWAALPTTQDAADQVPKTPAAQDNQATAPVDVFFIAPTTYYNRAGWNAPIDDADARERLDGFVLKYQASAFNGSARVYAPLYRQATLGAFFPENRDDGDKALALAYEDVRRAFRHYMKNDNEGRPFILAAHSQGSRHLSYLLRDEIDGTPLARRMVAAYAVGYALPMDLFSRVYKDIQPCTAPRQTGCLASWNSFALQDADPASLFDNVGFHYDGVYEANRGKSLLCVNPLRWDTSDENAPAVLNLGALPTTDDPLGVPDTGITGAHCKDGVLYASPPDGKGYSGLVLPGGNYHIYDYNLFYMNIRDNVANRVAAFLAAPRSAPVPVP
ncbi:DUF3089 domain-containing protein [Emcibacter sp. SYSU 3D8]|uniref:DUF3089 domain-containing protein n=1 Tax=Emcibacter sp. SYSU 3D8 TaxID=3133969 RepID=UPI0031FECDC6